MFFHNLCHKDTVSSLKFLVGPS